MVHTYSESLWWKLVILFTLVTLVTLFLSYKQFYGAECITVSEFFLFFFYSWCGSQLCFAIYPFFFIIFHHHFAVFESYSRLVNLFLIGDHSMTICLGLEGDWNMKLENEKGWWRRKSKAKATSNLKSYHKLQFKPSSIARLVNHGKQNHHDFHIFCHHHHHHPNLHQDDADANVNDHAGKRVKLERSCSDVNIQFNFKILCHFLILPRHLSSQNFKISLLRHQVKIT